MDFYFDISISSTKKKSSSVIMNYLCSIIHKKLFDIRSNSIGISFPNYNVTLGNIIRLHGRESDLIKILMNSEFDRSTSDYSVGEINKIPKIVKYRTLTRIQPTMSQSKFRRLLKRNPESLDSEKNYKLKMLSEKSLDLPYIDLVSESNGQRYRRYIKMSDLFISPRSGEFDFFGFSKEATIPWFD